MKKNYYLFVFLLPVYFLLSYSSGAPFGHTGSPGDNGHTCNQCHTYSGSGYNPDFVIDGIPPNGYLPGQTYQLTLTVNNVNTIRKGFEACIENASHQKQGTFANVDNNTQTLQSNTYITHTSSSNTHSSWSFNWTAPANENDLTLYFAVNMANGNGSSTGDYIENSQVTIPISTNGNVEEISKKQIKLFPNPATDIIRLDTGNYQFEYVGIRDIQGKTYPVSIENNRINVSFLPTGTYFLQLKNEKNQVVKEFIKK